MQAEKSHMQQKLEEDQEKRVET